MIRLTTPLFLFAVAMAIGSSSAQAAWSVRTFDQVSIASIRSSNQISVRTVDAQAMAPVSAKLYLIQDRKRLRAWLALETDTGGDVIFNCDDGMCALAVHFDAQAPNTLKACFSDGPRFGMYRAVKFDATNQLFANLKASKTMRVEAPALTGISGEAPPQKAVLSFTFELSELPITVKGSDDICESDFAGG